MPSLQSDLRAVPGPQSASPRGEAEDLGGELKGTEECQKVQLVEKPKPKGEEGEWLRGGRGLVSVKFLSEEDIIEVMVRFQASADLPQFGARSLLTRRTVELELETRLMGTRT